MRLKPLGEDTIAYYITPTETEAIICALEDNYIKVPDSIKELVSYLESELETYYES